ncbi:MAG: hypothetical protein ABSA46_19615 [Thermodesulfovibrionales bacterium]
MAKQKTIDSRYFTAIIKRKQPAKNQLRSHPPVLMGGGVVRAFTTSVRLLPQPGSLDATGADTVWVTMKRPVIYSRRTVSPQGKRFPIGARYRREPRKGANSPWIL